MSKRNTGATLGVIVAVSFGATAYASTMSNLDSDTNSKALLDSSVTYVESSDYSAKLKDVKADYTSDVKDTKIGQSDEDKVEKQTVEKAVASLSEELKTLKGVALGEDSSEEDNKVTIEEDEAVKEDDQTENSSDENSLQEVDQYVNVEILNVRSDANQDSDVIQTLEMGDKVSGVKVGDWLVTKNGYVNLAFLQDYYPENASKELAERKEAERIAEEARLAAEQAQADKEAAEAAKQAQADKEAAEAAKQAQADKEAAEAAKQAQTVSYTGWVNTASLNVRSSGSTSSSIINTLTKGDKVSGTLSNGWLKISTNSGVGYISASYLSDTEVSKPQVQVPVVEEKDDVVEDNSNQEQSQPTASASGQSAANIAQQFVGYPYVWGASDPSRGFDCSGLVFYAYQQVGVSLSRNSAAQFSNGYAVDSRNLVPGDLVFFYTDGSIGHVGMITGYNGEFIHASTPSTGVVYGNIYSSYYQSCFAGARRIF